MSSPIAFVPTMGALHDGHLDLIGRARSYSDDVVVSIFVNPLQFENPDDLARYPRDLEGDIEKAMAAGASKVWSPSYEEIYPGEIKKISAGVLGTIYEGKHRAGHFDGMLTVVNRLFEIVKPGYAIFGEKDVQQLFIVKRWATENQIPVEIVAAPTVRAEDGLALSSRNVRLTPSEREAALVISRALMTQEKSMMLDLLASEPLFELDYAEIIDEETFEVALESTLHKRAIVAGWINGVRLIDNMPMESTK